ncbi:MAG: leucyl/phenylalanyl-tRNA--protein transferase [Betaproteobacteria bacterium]
MIPWLGPNDSFPPVALALAEPNGLLAAGDRLDADLLVQAYSRGIFPWYSDDQPVLWWSPDPRMVLVPVEFKISRSLRKRLRAVARGSHWRVTLDTAFTRLMRACAAPRDEDGGTWITDAMVAAYTELHRRGLAHSVEVWAGDELIGGLYGVSLGRMFFGESMFSRATDASKTALAALVQVMRTEEVPLIDCQQATRHLASLGAREIARRNFCLQVAQLALAAPIDWRRWQAGDLTTVLHAY